MRLCGISSRFQLLSPSTRQVTHALLTRPPLTYISLGFNVSPFDLHVLGTPPAFILSQDQTLMLKWCLCPASFIWHCLLLIRVACQSFDQLACSWISLKILEFSGLHYCLFVKDHNLLLRKSCVALLLFSATALIFYHNHFCLSTTFFKYFWHLTTADGEGGIWTLAPLLTTCTLSRGVPSTSWVLLQIVDSNNLYNYRRHECLAERVGFEPTRPFGQTVFKTASLWPLRYLSECVS